MIIAVADAIYGLKPDGRQAWGFTLPAEATISNPVIRSGQVIVAYGLSPKSIRVVSLRLVDGELSWSRDVEVDTPARLLWLTGLPDRVLVASDASGGRNAWAVGGDGSLLWSSTTIGAVAPPASADGRVIVQGLNGVAALDSRTGKRLWLNELVRGEVLARDLLPAIADGVVLVADSPAPEELPTRIYALDFHSGQPVREIRVPDGVERFMLYSGKVIVQSVTLAGERIARYSLKEFREEAAWQIEGGRLPSADAILPIGRDLLVAGGTDTASTPGHNAVALLDESGVTRWRLPIPREEAPLTDVRINAVVPVDDGLLVTTNNGLLIALSKS